MAVLSTFFNQKPLSKEDEVVKSEFNKLLEGVCVGCSEGFTVVSCLRRKIANMLAILVTVAYIVSVEGKYLYNNKNIGFINLGKSEKINFLIQIKKNIKKFCMYPKTYMKIDENICSKYFDSVSWNMA